ncbi:T9SS type A sorting domain-containing protein [Aequorivita xiaoshiensis]|uniref:T9SS type A sorting domain-containing protein n=1 Tax=Aequorivita xiaoshiensis TaxID=2874476 RepID=A0A9X1U455_9FLAO|nr:T9SS type A sorting domain-containing protein [Aequorivita xiaoshiensis]MCG2430500.1 T9SS type A sorting domain-containing protein [Aequorivita xiaoshiensis]
MKKVLLFTAFVFATMAVSSQSTKKVLFIGNSYTAANNLPLMVSEMANSTGDILIYDSYTPGGFRFMDHATNSTTLSKISSDNWDYVTLQGQSQETSLSQSQMEIEVFPYVEALSNAIRTNNECSQPLFYMTWGRKDGDAQNCAIRPWVCTYEEMDDVIKATYSYLAETNQSELAPAGAVWRYIRENHPNFPLYSSDGSHPSLAGSYAVACAFYAMIYKKDPTFISWNSSLDENQANIIKAAAKTIVYDEIANWDFTEKPVADFTEEIIGSEVSFSNTSSNFHSIYWDFGDGYNSTETNPVHTYNEGGVYNISQTIAYCGKSATKTKTIEVPLLNIDKFQKEQISIYPNPATDKLFVNLDNNYQNIEVSIFDIYGKKLLNLKLENKNSFKLNLSNLDSSIYTFTLRTENAKFIRKIIIK